MGKEEEDIQQKINKAFREEGADAVRHEIESNEKRLASIRNARRVLEFFCGRGMADGMPLGEGLGFLDVELLKAKPEMNGGEIQRARDFLAEIIGEEYPHQMPLGALMEKFAEEEKELLA